MKKLVKNLKEGKIIKEENAMANITKIENVKNGTVRAVIITRPVEVMAKLVKANPELANLKIEKVTRTVARIGIKYANMKGYVAPAEETKRPVTGHYLSGEDNRVLETGTGKICLALKKGINPYAKGKTTWYLNGQEAPYKDIEKYLYAKDKYKEKEESLLGYLVDIEQVEILPTKKEMAKMVENFNREANKKWMNSTSGEIKVYRH